MLRAGLAESLHPTVARAVLLAALVPAFLAFDEYFGLLAVDVGAWLAWVPLLVALTVAAQAVGAALAPRLPMYRLGPVLVVAGLLVAAGAAAARPLGFVAVAVGYGALQAAIVVAETDLQHRIEGRARATVTSVSGLLSELGAIGLYAFVALGSAAATTATLIAILSIVVALGGLVAAKAYPATWRKPTDSPGRYSLSALPQVVEGDDPDDRVAARRRVVGQEHQGLPVGWHLDRPEHQALARKLAAAGPVQRCTGQPEGDPVGVGGDGPGRGGQPSYAAAHPVRPRPGRHPEHGRRPRRPGVRRAGAAGARVRRAAPARRPRAGAEPGEPVGRPGGPARAGRRTRRPPPRSCGRRAGPAPPAALLRRAARQARPGRRRARRPARRPWHR